MNTEELVKELNLYKQALTKAISLPRKAMPSTKDWYTVMLCGNCIVKKSIEGKKK